MIAALILLALIVAGCVLAAIGFALDTASPGKFTKE